MKHVVPESARGLRLDQHLAQSLPALSRARVQALIEGGHVTIDGQPARAAQRVKGLESVEYRVPEPEAAEPQAQELPLTVVFEDRHLLVLNKAAGMVVHPGAGNRDGTLVNALLHRVKDLGGVGGVLRPGLVHRLDKDTSGLMVVAKHDQALEALQRAFAARDVEKIYLALVHGQPDDQGTFRTLYGRHPRQRLRFSGKVKTGKSAVTHYRVTTRLQAAALVEVTLETGRTHQIRAHFSEAGFPLWGDALYGGVRRGDPVVIARQALHAFRLSFLHPKTGKPLSFETDPPADFQAAVKALTPARR